MRKHIMFVKRSTVERARQKNFKRNSCAKVNHFARVKNDELRDQIRRFGGKRHNIYFDTETFEYYEDEFDNKEIPKIIPYYIGACTDEPGSYVEFFGIDAGIKFVDWLYATCVSTGKDAKSFNLCAFNLDYDFQAIRPILVDLYFNEIEIHYEMTDTKRFIFGDISNRKGKERLKIRLVDLWRWDTTKSLANYMKHIVSMTYDEKQSTPDNPVIRQKKVKEGDEVKLVPDPIAERFHKKMTQWGFNQSSFKKLEIDYCKVNLHQAKDGNWYYYRTKRDWIQRLNAIKLDLETEQRYLKVDVTSLPLVYLEQLLMRDLALETLNLKGRTIDRDCSITAPGFAKYLCEEYEKKFMTETYRKGVNISHYKRMVESYTGAFVGGNREITYLDQEVFEKMFPKESFYDENNQPKIRSYDVNSMYPWAMHRGLPYGPVCHIIPGPGPYVTWYEIQFNSLIDPDHEDPEQRLYKWKKPYSYLNNSFFGSQFRLGLRPGTEKGIRVFVLKELYDLFISMCDVDCTVLTARYQKVSTDLRPFIDELYKIKQNKDGYHPPSTVKLIKLMLNSLYGKMAEKFKERKFKWAIDIDTFVLNNPSLVEHLEEMGIKEIDSNVTKSTEFKRKVSPYVDLKNRCGYFYVENTEKRYNHLGHETRESITAGIYITAISRYKLLSSVKGEIDQGNIVLYCDTDSIKMVQRKKPKFECDKSALGAWKDEGSFTHFGHPNKLKKYFMHNSHTGQWMVKTSGVSVSFLKTPDGTFDLETIKTCYNPKNRILIKRCKPDNIKNEWFQTVIRRVDFKFVYEDEKQPPTHIMDEGVLKPYGK